MSMNFYNNYLGKYQPINEYYQALRDEYKEKSFNKSNEEKEILLKQKLSLGLKKLKDIKSQIRKYRSKDCKEKEKDFTAWQYELAEIECKNYLEFLKSELNELNLKEMDISEFESMLENNLSDNTTSKYLNFKQAAKYANCSISYIYKLTTQEGKIPYTKSGVNLILKSDLDAYLEGHKCKSNEDREIVVEAKLREINRKKVSSKK